MRHVGRRLFRRLPGRPHGAAPTVSTDAGAGLTSVPPQPTHRRHRILLVPFVAAALLAVAAFGSNELPSLHPRVDDASASLYSTTYTFGTENSWVRVQNI